MSKSTRSQSARSSSHVASGQHDAVQSTTADAVPKQSVATSSKYPSMDDLSPSQSAIALDPSARKAYRQARILPLREANYSIAPEELMQLNSERQYWSAEFFAAMINPTDAQDKPRTEGHRKLVAEAHFDVEDILAGACRLWDMFIDGASFGWVQPVFATSQFLARVNRSSKHLPCHERLQKMCIAMRREKKVAIEVIQNEKTAMQSFVYHPDEWLATKSSSRQSNATRQQRINEVEKRGRKRSAPEDDESSEVRSPRAQKAKRGDEIATPSTTTSTTNDAAPMPPLGAPVRVLSGLNAPPTKTYQSPYPVSTQPMPAVPAPQPPTAPLPQVSEQTQTLGATSQQPDHTSTETIAATAVTGQESAQLQLPQSPQYEYPEPPQDDTAAVAYPSFQTESGAGAGPNADANVGGGSEFDFNAPADDEAAAGVLEDWWKDPEFDYMP